MAKIKNKRIYSKNIEWLRMLQEECHNYTGRECSLDVKEGCLTIFALPQKKKVKPKEDKVKVDRNKLAEKHARD